MSEQLVVRGAREHNLKNLSVELPRDRLIVFTGLSGSGKSSLAFDTIYPEGQRRYVESLSAYARQFLGQMDKPDVDVIEGLSPAISIDQKSASRNPRSTVGTITEVYDYLRLLYARIGEQHCPADDTRLSRQTPQQIVDRILKLDEGTRFQVLAPVVRGRKGEYETLLEDLSGQGYVRARVDGETVQIDEFLAREEKLARYEQHDIEVVVDRLVLREGIERRLTDSLESALTLADGVAQIELVGAGEGGGDETLTFSQHLACPTCGASHPEPAPRNFSFNSPYGACETCDGLGTTFEVDPELIIPDTDLSVHDGAIAPWRSAHTQYFVRMLESVAEANDIDLDTAWSSLPAKQQRILLHGTGGQLTVRYRNRYGRQRSYNTEYEGVIPWIKRRHEQADSDWTREQFEGYMREVPCSACGGARLRPFTLAVTVNGRNISEVCEMSIRDSAEFLMGLELGERDRMIAERVTKEINARLGFLLDVGLDYLTLARSAGTLAGGEAQRIRLASQIGSGLVGTLYVLDEPSIGLHQRDNERLLATLVHLRDLGNTVIVVEHDEDAIRLADYVVDIGPGAGVHGGQVVSKGTPQQVMDDPASLTGKYLSGKVKIAVPAERTPLRKDWLRLKGACGNNLQKVNLEIPVGLLTCVTGVSGSGKSTLINNTLFPITATALNGATTLETAPYDSFDGLQHLDKVVDIDQSPIGRTPRSNPATYTGLFTPIRDLFAGTQEARSRGYKAGRFSFNVKGGRCEACQGDGLIKVEMHFLPDIYVPCDVCKSKRYNRETLEIKYKGKSIHEVLEMTIEEAREFFDAVPAIARKLQTLIDVGLSYIRLGQSATTLSGGEAQRVKLARELSKRDTGKTLYILDEPTTGLHFADIQQLLDVLHRLRDHGNTVVVIEHNLDVIKTADWIVDLGPEGGSRGGQIIATGTPEQVAAEPASHTGRFLGPLLERDRA